MKKGHLLRNLSVMAQKNDFNIWKDSVSYGQIDGLLKLCFLP